jgi:glycosyltransferase involved in cell wall biosynthesis
LDLGKDLKLLKSYSMDVWHSLFFYYAPLALFKPNVFVTAHGDDCFSQQVKMPCPGTRILERHLLWRLPAGVRRALNGCLNRFEWGLNYLFDFCSLFFVRRIITVSGFTQARLGRRFPPARSKISVIPPGVSSGFFGAAGAQSAAPFFLTVARVDESDRIKNIHSVILALAELKDDYAFEYVIVSGNVYGSYRSELESLITEKGLKDRVRIESRISDQELEEYYRRASLFILAPYAEAENFEGFGIVFLEANASGVPVLTSKEGGMADYVIEGLNGFYVEAPTALGIKAALSKFLNGSIRFDRQRIKTCPEKFRWTHIADRVLDVYRQHGSSQS